MQTNEQHTPNLDPPLDSHGYRTALGHFCSGVTIVTSTTDDGPVGFACQSFSSLSLDPPLVLLCAGKTSSSWPRIAATGLFCVNVLAEHQEDVCRAFAASGTDKFAGVGWDPGPRTESPILRGVLASIECRLEDVVPGGDHVIAIGRVLGLHTTATEPLLFFRGRYRGLSNSADS